MLKGGTDSSNSLTSFSIFEGSPTSLALGILLISLTLSLTRLEEKTYLFDSLLGICFLLLREYS
jgi:hypothetical protein